MLVPLQRLLIPETYYDMVRVGVALYGQWPSPDTYHLHLQETNKMKDNSLRQVLSWKTNVMDIKSVKEGEFIGYGTAFQAVRDMKVAVFRLVILMDIRGLFQAKDLFW
ncbi:MAG: alanine racemase C-terminal domain-containing protein [Melioribacteraceae bacterium]|nr:alanine racemase C-terminal domain-containing protein [Melioribacteraceae bacterium]